MWIQGINLSQMMEQHSYTLYTHTHTLQPIREKFNEKNVAFYRNLFIAHSITIYGTKFKNCMGMTVGFNKSRDYFVNGICNSHAQCIISNNMYFCRYLTDMSQYYYGFRMSKWFNKIKLNLFKINMLCWC